MDLRQLTYFLAVLEEGSFTRAAARVHVVQSGLSASVAALEKDLGVTLFDRTTRRVELTEAGRELAAHARAVLDAAEHARDSVAEVAGGLRGSLRIGVMHALLSRSVVRALAEFRRQRPDARLLPRTSAEGSAGLIEAVASNTLDIAFAATSIARLPGVAITVIRSEAMVLVCPPEHRLAQRQRIAPEELADETFIDVPIGWGSRASADRVFDGLGIARRIEVEIGDVTTVLDLVRVGLGVAIIAASSAPSLDGLVTVAIEPAPDFNVCMVLPANRPVKPAAQIVADLVVEQLNTDISP